ncbi:MAG: hypothetical protein ACLP8X_30200, partial [Streptosporangiaceae bacterium]
MPARRTHLGGPPRHRLAEHLGEVGGHHRAQADRPSATAWGRLAATAEVGPESITGAAVRSATRRLLGARPGCHLRDLVFHGLLAEL